MWSVAFYCGLRRGELRGLRWSSVDFDANLIRVERAWDDDPEVGEIAVKSDAGRRHVPIVGRVRSELVAHKLRTGRGGDDLVFGRTATDPFVNSTVRSRALRAWEAENAQRLKDAAPGEDVRVLESVALHEARHCAVSYLSSAGIDPLQVMFYAGHADLKMTARYWHTLPDAEATAAAKMDAYLEGAAG